MRPLLRAVLPFALALSTITASAQFDTTLRAIPDTGSANLNQRVAAYTISAADLDAELNSQDVSGVLQSSRDVFNSVAGFTFGQARFRIRGFDGENTLLSLNGVLVNDLESGFASFTNWGGLNDVTRWLETRTGVTPSRYNFGGVGGYSEINLRASELRRGTRFSYALTNRAYTHRIMLTHNTGMMANGWAFSISGSRRWADEGYVPGTSYDAGAYFISAEKKLNARHSICFTGLGAPIRQGRQGLAVQEALDLADDNYYNPNWGYQEGKKRNSRMSNDHKPILLLTHIFKANDSTEWTSSFLYSFGRDGATNLNWFDAKDPRPDYYRYLPSYYSASNPDIAADLTSAWQNEENARQIDWNRLYQANYNNLYTVQNANGVSGNNITGLRSKYIVEDQRADPTRLALNTVWSKALKNDVHVTAGGSWNKQKTHYFKTLLDLLGGDFWVDLNQFAELDSNDPNGSQNNLDNPNHVVKVGDEFSYDYDIHTQLINAFGQVEKKFRNMEAYAGLSLSQTSFWREGRYTNGLFPTNSKGKSDKESFTNVGIKAGAIYKLSGRHYLSGNAAFVSRPPSTRTAFLSPRTRNSIIQGLTSENVLAGDISYLARMPKLKGRATLYYAKISDQLWNRSFFNEDFLTLVNYSMTGVDQTHMGLELGLEAKVSPTWNITAVIARGQYTYSSRPSATITRDNLDTAVAVGRTVYWDGYRVGGMPQTAMSLGARYQSPKFWSVGANLNYFNDIYLDPNPDRRTSEAVEGLVTDDPQWDKLLDQTKLDDGVTLDIYATKSWMYKRKYRIALNASVSNVLDNQDLITGGFEQLRFDTQNPDKFPARYGYMFGRTFFAMLTFSF